MTSIWAIKKVSSLIDKKAHINDNTVYTVYIADILVLHSLACVIGRNRPSVSGFVPGIFKQGERDMMLGFGGGGWTLELRVRGHAAAKWIHLCQQ